MKNWNYVFLIKWLLAFMALLHDGSSYTIDRNVCRETPFVFALGNKRCKFTLADANRLLKTDVGICPQICHVKIDSLENTDYWNSVINYQLEYVNLSFSGLVNDFTAIRTGCNKFFPEKRTLEIICKTDDEDVDISNGLCRETKDCKDETKECLLTQNQNLGLCTCKSGFIGFETKCLNAVNISNNLCRETKDCKDETKECLLTQNQNLGICTCKSGFIGFETECLNGNRKLNETCQRNEQCSSVFGSVCQKDACVCGPGYDPLNDSECVLSSSGSSNTQASVQDQNDDNIVNVAIGSMFGGLILGAIITAFVVFIYHHVRQGNSNKKELIDRECPKNAVFNNTSYEIEVDTVMADPALHRRNERKIINVPPFAHSVELPTKNIQEASERFMVNKDVNADVYNHLHEKEDCIEENYDHLQGNLDPGNEEGDYSNLHAGGRYKESEVSASVDDDYDVQEPTSDYCSLAKQ